MIHFVRQPTRREPEMLKFANSARFMMVRKNSTDGRNLFIRGRRLAEPNGNIFFARPVIRPAKAHGARRRRRSGSTLSFTLYRITLFLFILRAALLCIFPSLVGLTAGGRRATKHGCSPILGGRSRIRQRLGSQVIAQERIGCRV